MILKFEGIDGSGKTTLCDKVYETLSASSAVAKIAEFSRAPEDGIGLSAEESDFFIAARSIALSPTGGCDDIERQLLLNWLSRRTNRIRIPTLLKTFDCVVCDRSTLSNAAYAKNLEGKIGAIQELSTSNIETANFIFWIDTPPETCWDRLKSRKLDMVEKKGLAYLSSVRDTYSQLMGNEERVIRINGTKSVEGLVADVMRYI